MTFNLDNFRHFLVRKFNYGKKIKIIDINFNKHWSSIFGSYKLWVFRMLAVVTFGEIRNVVFPLAIAYSLEQLDFWLFFWIICLQVFVGVLLHFGHYIHPILSESMWSSIQINVTRFFLTTDPMNHASKSSGQIISKSTKAAHAADAIQEIMTYEIVPIFVSLISVVTGLAFYSWKYALVGLSGLLVASLGGAFLNWLGNKIFTPEVIKLEDKIKHMEVENLQQTQYIRSVFATDQKYKHFATKNCDLGILAASDRRFGGWSIAIPYNLSYAFLMLLGYILIDDVQNNQISVVVATSLIFIYIRSIWPLIFIGEKVRRLAKSISHLDDLFQFIRGYGKQSYPVLQNSKLKQ